MQTLGLFGTIGWQELLIIGGILLILFGRRLPEVGRSLGQGIVQFKKGLRDIEDEVERGVNSDASTRAPLSEGSDKRVSRSDSAGAPQTEATPTTPGA
ncbi:MAG: twin-arginine translocase TatA/TatE family subunit [Phycisphaerales bacterium]